MNGLQDPERFLFYVHQVDITQYGASGLFPEKWSTRRALTCVCFSQCLIVLSLSREPFILLHGSS